MEGMKRLKASSDVPVIMDEGVKLPHHALCACKYDVCDVINIKLMKCGGIYPALQIYRAAEHFCCTTRCCGFARSSLRCRAL